MGVPSSEQLALPHVLSYRADMSTNTNCTQVFQLCSVWSPLTETHNVSANGCIIPRRAQEPFLSRCSQLHQSSTSLVRGVNDLVL